MDQAQSFHPLLVDKLNHFITNDTIPNIIFHGPSGTGKRTLVEQFVMAIYEQNKEHVQNYVMNINCAHGKGIKFVREELKFFARTHMNIPTKLKFKTVILTNADNLTTDAQSALRRCIELFTHTTRFFIVVQDKYKLLKPILSRLCQIHVPEPILNKVPTNLYQHYLQQTFHLEATEKQRLATLLGLMRKHLCEAADVADHMTFIQQLYDLGYSGLDLMTLLKQKAAFPLPLTELTKCRYLLLFEKVKSQFRNEKLFMLFIVTVLLQPEEDTARILSRIGFM
jgi:hypothetical protein